MDHLNKGTPRFKLNIPCNVVNREDQGVHAVVVRGTMTHHRNGQSTLVNKLFTKNEKPGVLGFQTAAASLAAMLMTFLGGILVDVQWNFGYLVYLIALPGMIGCFLFLPNIVKALPRALEQTDGENETEPRDAASGAPAAGDCPGADDLAVHLRHRTGHQPAKNV